jgi:uncharacterized membrane protein YtjA (UPF0391 family)
LLRAPLAIPASRAAAQISKILFFIFLVLFIVILILAISAGQLIL